MIFIPLLRGHGDLDGGAPRSRTHDADFLDATRDERALLAERARARAVAAATRALPGRLEELWSDRHVSPATRRRLLFALWEECGDDEAGAAARAAIVDFVHARLPRGTTDAFTDAELDELNRGRQGAARFTP